MKGIRSSTSGIFLEIGMGAVFTVILLCIGSYFVTGSVTAIGICLITAFLLSIWAFALVHVLQRKIGLFTNEVCETIDDMMRGEKFPRMIYDEDTMLDRICHQLNRLYRIQQTNQENVEKQRKDLQELISDISHQVKTPATNLKMAAASLLEQEYSRPQQIEYLQSISTQIDKLDFLINALVKSSRLETGVISLEKRPSLLYETLAIALGGIFLKAEEKNLQVTVDCPEDLVLPHDSKWTAEAIFNVLENAVKYTPAGGKIRVSVIRWENFVKIDILDSGKGIAESRQGVIFKRFYREPEVYNMEGIGLGLYLTREIISKQGGSIKVISEEGKGAMFTIFLPNE